MALQKQTITIDFGFGALDQKPDAKRLQPVKFVELVDARFSKIGRLDSRRAFEAFGSHSLTALRLLENDGQIFAVSAPSSKLPHVYRFNPDGSAFSQTVLTNERAPDVMPAAEVVAQQFGPTSPWATESTTMSLSYAQSDNYLAVVYHQDGSGLFVELYNRETSALAKSITVNGTHAQIFAHPDGRDEFVFGCANGTTVLFNLITPSTTPVALSGLPDEASVSSSRWDAAVCADATESTSAMIMVIYAKGASGVKLVNAAWPGSGGSGTPKSSTTIATATSTTLVAMSGFANVSNTTANFRPIWSPSTTTSVYSGTYNHSITEQLAPAVVFTSTQPATLGGVVFDDGTAHAWAGGSLLGFVSARSIDTSNVSTTIGAPAGGGLGRMTQMLSKPMGLSSGVSYLWASYSFTTNENTSFLIGAGTGLSHIQARAFHLRSWTNSPLHTPPCAMVSDTLSREIVTVLPRLNRSATVVGGDSAAGNWGFCRTVMKPLVGWHGCRGRELITTGGWGGVLNGVDAPIPTAPLIFPVVKLNSVTSSGGALTAASYFVSGFFEMVDDRGLLRRSEPATPLQVTLSGTQVAFAVTVSNYALLDGLSGRCRFVATRTLADESQVYYRDASYSTTSTTSAIAVSFTKADATIAAYEPMYTTGGIAEDSAASCLLTIASNGKRTLAVFGDDPNFVVEAKPERGGLGTAFMDGVGKRISTGGDRIYALASYMERWFAFKSEGVYVATGDGADPTGQNDTLSEFEQLTNGIGCVDPRSVLVTSAGIVYLSPRGFYLIGADLSPRYIGADVEDYVSDFKANRMRLVDACHDAIGAPGEDSAPRLLGVSRAGTVGERCVFLFQGDGVIVSESTKTTLVLSIFSTTQGMDFRWSEDSQPTGGVTAVVAKSEFGGGRLYIARGSAIAAESNEDSGDEYLSAIDAPSLIATTAWLPMGAIQGFGRIYKTSIIGHVPFASSSLTVTVAVAYDGSQTWSETYKISTDLLYNNGQFEFGHQRGHCMSVRYRITQTSDTSSIAFMPSQIQQTVGIKAPANKLPTSARAPKT